MAIVKIIDKVYNNEETGEKLPYKRLAIIGTIGGEVNTLEIKLEKSELLLAKLLLNSTEENRVEVKRPIREEEELFKKNISRKDEIDLFDRE